MTNSADPDQTAPQGAVWPGSTQFCQTNLSFYLDFYGIQHLKHNILRKKYFAMISQG